MAEPPATHAESTARAPARPLRGLVSYHGYDVRGAPPGVHRGLPSPFLTLVVGLDAPVRLAGPDGRPVGFRACLGGLHLTPAHVVHDGDQCGVHVAVTPPAARALFGLPAGELAGVTVETGDVVGRLGTELAERTAAAPDWESRFAALDAVLLRLLARHDRRADASPEIRHAWRALTTPDPDGGPARARAPGAPVRAAAREVGWHTDHLARRFRGEFGVGPTVLRRMARFDRARHDVAARARGGPDGGLVLADVAARHGFADQAHLAREFRAFAGCSPSTWVAEEIHGGLAPGAGVVGSVQDTDPGPGPRSAA